jgi:hypothetical protein
MIPYRFSKTGTHGWRVWRFVENSVLPLGHASVVDQLSFDADPDPDPTPSFTCVEKLQFLKTFIHWTACLNFRKG